MRHAVTMRSRWTGSSANVTLSRASEADPRAISTASSATRGTSSADRIELAANPHPP